MPKPVLTERDISPNDYEAFKQFLESSCGVLLGENKQYLVINRLQRVSRDFNIENFSDLVKDVSSGRNSKLRLAVIDAMTTHETFWFRDSHPYEHLKTLLKDLSQQKNGTGEIRIWSAACSTGQEPYSISIVVDELKEANAIGNTRVQVVATDVSDHVIAQARSGIYPSLAVNRGLTADVRARYFDRTDEGDWQIKPHLKKGVDFRPLNLMGSFELLGRFDIIFIRNVLIYFSQDLKADILNRAHRMLAPVGYLFLGASESMQARNPHFRMERYNPGIVYRKI
jgi:chemotaxis protein methyltransferase CheR